MVTTVDEELASSGIQQVEVIRSKRNERSPTIQITEQRKPARRSCLTPFRISCALVLICAIIAGTVSGVFTKLKETATSSDFDLFDPSTWHIDINPHGDGRDTPFDFNTWESPGCAGLELHVIDNLEDKWEPYFKRSIADWDNGEPDVLTLHVRKPTFFGPGCEPSEGLLKVRASIYLLTSIHNHIDNQYPNYTALFFIPMIRYAMVTTGTLIGSVSVSICHMRLLRDLILIHPNSYLVILCSRPSCYFVWHNRIISRYHE